MPYKFAQERPDYSDLAGGRVFYHMPGHPALPIRLASEVFQRCLSLHDAAGNGKPVTLYDPCCGTAYHLGTLAYLHWFSLQTILAADIDPQALYYARRNLALLTVDGLDQRLAEIAEMYRLYRKESHLAALDSAHKLRQGLVERSRQHPLQVRLFEANALEPPAWPYPMEDTRADLVITDIPYGHHSQWHGTAGSGRRPIGALLDSLHPLLHAHSMVAIISDKEQKVAHEGFRRMERFQIGKRQIVILQPEAYG